MNLCKHRTAWPRCIECHGVTDLPFDREEYGRFVREEWVRWALEQPNPKPSWLVPYDELAEADKEADRRIGECIAKWTMIGCAARYAVSGHYPESITSECAHALAAATGTAKTPQAVECEASQSGGGTPQRPTSVASSDKERE